MAQLSIYLSAIAANYKTLKSKVGKGCEVACVIKANAYGLGMAPVSKLLYDHGCTHFFVATLPEAIELRMILGDSPSIAMLNGYDDEYSQLYIENNVTPVLNTIDQLNTYKASANNQNKKLPAIAHIDTGMNRLGMRANEIQSDSFDGLEMKSIMSHFISSEEKDNALNEQQHAIFKKVAFNFPDIPKSLCNSSGIFLHDSYHYDNVRPGMALYGLNPTPYQNNPMQPVVKLDAKILQVKNVKKGETAGYNATHRFTKDSHVAIVDIGYADGILRSVSNSANLYYNAIACPIRGNVSMDLTIVDLGNIASDQMPKSGDMMEVIGENQTADDLARDAGTAPACHIFGQRN